jgi:hypothetical protein
MPNATRGVLLTWCDSTVVNFRNQTCLTPFSSDATIKQYILALDREMRFIIADLDETHLLVILGFQVHGR